MSYAVEQVLSSLLPGKCEQTPILPDNVLPTNERNDSTQFQISESIN